MGRAEAANVEAEQARPRTSLKLGKYQLLAVLGRGGMAEVFLALSRGAMGFDKLAVIKRLRPGLAEDESFRTMFLDEARLAARLNHPNVVHTYEVGEHDGVYFMAMEYLEGQSLNKIVREAEKRGHPLEPVVCARIISDALLGLHHAHTLKDFDGRPLEIIHRDISPHNLFVTYEGTTKVVDFGIAKAALSSTQTEVGVLKGKVAYMSPEQATGAPIDARSDVFAMGIVLWEMLTQRRLMTGDSAASTIHRLLTAPIPAASSMRHEVGATLDSIVECALEKDPNRRFASALAMREAIEAYLTATGRVVRTEEIGEQVGAMFVDVREAIKRQIQEHVEGAGRVASGGGGGGGGEDSQVRSNSEVRPRDGTMVSNGSTGELPLLNAGGGSGSGVLSSQVSRVSIAEPQQRQGSGTQVGAGMAGAGQMGPQSTAAPQSMVAPTSGTSKLLMVAAFGLLFIAAVGASVAAVLFLNKQNAPVAVDPNVTQFGAPHAPTAPTAAPPTPTTATAAALPPATPATVPPAPATAAPTADPASATNPAPKSTHSHHTSGAAATPPPAAPSEGVGYVTFDTYPWTRVSEGGNALGTTPLVHVSMPAGTHTLTLDNPEQGIHQTYAITVKAGDSMTKRLGLK